MMDGRCLVVVVMFDGLRGEGGYARHLCSERVSGA